MRKQLLNVMVFCAACLVAGAQAQTSSGTPGSAGGSSSDTSSSSGSSSSQMGSESRHMGATGRMGHQETRASQLTGSQITSSSGESLGTINDVIVNPTSGKIDFAVISLSGAAGTSAGGGEKLVPVPWSLLRPSGTAAAGGTSAQPSFVFSGDTSKLQAAPSFSQANWPDISQPNWRQSIYSHYGVSPGAATGGAESPGGMGKEKEGTSGGSQQPSSGGSSDSSSSGSSGGSSENP